MSVKTLSAPPGAFIYTAAVKTSVPGGTFIFTGQRIRLHRGGVDECPAATHNLFKGEIYKFIKSGQTPT